MPSRHHKFCVRRLLFVLFLCSFVLCLGLGHLSSTPWRVQWGNVAVAQSPDFKGMGNGKQEIVMGWEADLDFAQTSFPLKREASNQGIRKQKLTVPRSLSTVPSEAVVSVSQWVQKGVELYQAGDITGAIAQWETALDAYQTTNNSPAQALVLENLARAYQQIGQIDRAIHYWSETIAVYRQMGNQIQVGRMRVELAQAYSKLGQNRRAITILCHLPESENPCNPDSALQILRQQQDALGEAAALGSLGNAYRHRGEYDQAIDNLEKSLAIANQLDNPVYLASVLNSLGNAYNSLALVNYRRAESADTRGDSAKAEEFRQKALSNDAKALDYFQDSIEVARTENDQRGQMRGLVNSISVLYRTSNPSSAAAALTEARSLLSQLPDSRDKVYAAIDLANLLQPVTGTEDTSSGTQCLKLQHQPQAIELLQQAVSIAQRLNDSRAQSFALGKLGQLYECRQDYPQALDFTQQAQLSANQDLLAKDSLYLWQWQAGRIFKAQGKASEAVMAYEQAVTTLETIRSDILTADRDVQLDFRDAINPIYRELAQLRLEQASLPSIEPMERTKELSAALRTIDSLKLAELQNYFGNECVIAALNLNDSVDFSPATAVFSTIILKDRTAILVSLPNGEKRSAWIDIDSQALIDEINKFRRELERFMDFVYDPTQAQTLYDWLIRPFASDLEQAQVKTLVFIQDGILRSVPMAALHDGEKFLVQKYAIATTPSLTLTEKKALDREQLRALIIGLTKEAVVDGRRFPALSNVGKEVSQVKAQMPGSKGLLDQEFTRDRLQQELSQTLYPIIHIATHGEFGTEPEDTFLVTGDNGKLTIIDLEATLRRINVGSEAVELLALTACQTAAGDDRAALGLAGVAVQAGVKSALASLWFISDASTVKLVTHFYERLLDADTSKAEALREAQLELIEAEGQYNHPAYWAPFILIGNWL